MASKRPWETDEVLAEIHRSLSADPDYRQVRSDFGYAKNVMLELKRMINIDYPHQAVPLITSMLILYSQEMRGMGLPFRYRHESCPHFATFAVNRLPEGPKSTPLKGLLKTYLEIWRDQNPDQVIQLLYYGKPITKPYYSRC